MHSKSLFFSLSENFDLSQKIVKKLKTELSPIKITKFADGEIFCKPLVSVREKQVFLIHSISENVNESLMTLFIAIDAFKRSAPKEINVIIPYFAYARQDRKAEGRASITAKLMADLITTSGASRLLLVELHSDQIQGFFNIPIDHLKTIYTFAEYFKKELSFDDLVIIAPDFGAIKRARMLSELLHLPLAIIYKKREVANKCESVEILGSVKDKNCLIIDDMIDTGGTIINAAALLKQSNAKKIYVCATHGLFSNNALEKFQKAWEEKIIESIFVTDSINNKETKFLKIVSISDFLSEILKIYLTQSGSISDLYTKYIKEIEDIKHT